ncbi:ER protein Pkr1-domain-containing protein [Schizophyllum fasciatum]
MCDVIRARPEPRTDVRLLDQELATRSGAQDFRNGRDMRDGAASPHDAATAADPASASQSFFANILSPGSSFHPTFLLIADAAFVALFFVLLALLFVTRSLHFAILILVEAGLWLSVKWFVNELRKAEMEVRASAEKKDT